MDPLWKLCLPLCVLSHAFWRLFHTFYALTHFSNRIFSNQCFSLPWEAHFCKTTPSTFDQKYHFFDPQTASKRAFFITFARSRRSVARSVRYVFAPCPLQKPPVPRLPCIFRLQAPSAKTTLCISLAIFWISCAICSFPCAFNALHIFFLQHFFIFLEKCVPPSLRSMILKTSSMQNHAKTASPALQSHGLDPFWNPL